jgi:hypothetical protein
MEEYKICVVANNAIYKKQRGPYRHEAKRKRFKNIAVLILKNMISLENCDWPNS